MLIIFIEKFIMKFIYYFILNIFMIQFIYSLSIESLVAYLQLSKKHQVLCDIVKPPYEFMALHPQLNMIYVSKPCKITYNLSEHNILTLTFYASQSFEIYREYLYTVKLNYQFERTYYSIKVTRQYSYNERQHKQENYKLFREDQDILTADGYSVLVPNKYVLSLALPYVKVRLFTHMVIGIEDTFESSFADKREHLIIPNTIKLTTKEFITSLKNGTINVPTLDNIEIIKHIYDNIIKDKVKYCSFDGCTENTLYIAQEIRKSSIKSPLLIKILPKEGNRLNNKWRFHFTLIYRVRYDNHVYIVDEDAALAKDAIPTIESFLRVLDPELSGSILIII